MMKKEIEMKHLSPPSPEVRAIVKMATIAGIVIGAQTLVYVLARYFTGEQIVVGIALGLLTFSLYHMFQMFVDQERHKDSLRRLKDVA
jgi:ABC-type uncharacterized transport system permease subunit